MTPAWESSSQWRVLNVGVDSSAHFLRAWQAWRADPQRPHMLHYVALCGAEFQNTATNTNLEPLAEELDTQLWGLLPGFHRLIFDGGRVLLTLCLGDLQLLLKQQQFQADSVFLNHHAYPAADTLYTVKAITRLCRRGTLFVASHTDATLQTALKQCGFEITTPDGLKAIYNPSWTPKKSQLSIQPTTCVVIGAGLAGAAVASSLARRGWAVTLLDAASQPASGASSLPAGLLVSHTSPDDSPLSRLSRAGVRITLQQTRALLRHGTDWGQTGVLQLSLTGDSLNLPPAWSVHSPQAGSDWCYKASPQTLCAAGVLPNSPALWHVKAGWVKPTELVKAWLKTPGMTWRGNVQVTQIKQSKSSSGGWNVLDASGSLIAEADLVVLCAGYASQVLAQAAGAVAPEIQAIRGQVTVGLQADSTQLPPFPVNGNGGFIPGITTPQGPLWLMGASYERDETNPVVKPENHLDNLTRLQSLLPRVATSLSSQFEPQHAQAWAGIRCATPRRLPLVMPLMIDGADSKDAKSSAWTCTGMGSRGLSFAALCAELLAARLHAEPLPIDLHLANSLTQQALKTT